MKLTGNLSWTSLLFCSTVLISALSVNFFITQTGMLDAGCCMLVLRDTELLLPRTERTSAEIVPLRYAQLSRLSNDLNLLVVHVSPGLNRIELLICGQIYVVDFANCVQFRKDFSGRVRRIKRDFVTAPAIGVAGLVPSSS